MEGWAALCDPQLGSTETRQRAGLRVKMIFVHRCQQSQETQEERTETLTQECNSLLCQRQSRWTKVQTHVTHTQSGGDTDRDTHWPLTPRRQSRSPFQAPAENRQLTPCQKHKKNLVKPKKLKREQLKLPDQNATKTRATTEPRNQKTLLRLTPQQLLDQKRDCRPKQTPLIRKTHYQSLRKGL